MKKIILLLLLVLKLMMANELKDMVELQLYKTADVNLSLEEIKSKKREFQKISKDEKLSDKNMSYWVQVKFSDKMESGNYMVRYAYIDFDVSSFTKAQEVHKIYLSGSTKKFTFKYRKGVDSQLYYVHLIPTFNRFHYFIELQTMEEFYNDTDDYFYYLLFCGVMFGLVLMTGLYNAFMYYFNREKSFLYYALMQFFMVTVQLYYTGLILMSEESYLLYNILSLITAFFSALFVCSFFNTSIHLPKLDKILKFYMILLVIDIFLTLFTHTSFISEFKLYSIFGILYLVVAYLRFKQNFRPAIFFLIGWGILVLSLFAIEYFEAFLAINPLLFSSPIEAISLAIALAYKIKLIQDEKEQQKELMVHQSKLASMGEMIGNIAHQWRQPLTHLSYTVMNIEDAYKHNSLDEVYLDKKVAEATQQIEFMSQTIDDFKGFYEPNKAKELFSLAEESREVLDIMSYTFKQQDISVELKVIVDSKIKNYKNEYKQVLLNLLSNAKDALVFNGILLPKITIVIENRRVTVSDNAGGVDSKIIEKIFEPYFTTKEENSGIGLYMSKMIVEKNMGGKLTVRNLRDGAMFSMILKSC